MRRLGLILAFLAMSCVHNVPKPLTDFDPEKLSNPRVIIVTDEQSPIYDEVLVGIHIASRGPYQVFRITDDKMGQNDLLQHLVQMKPQGLIALGPKSVYAVSQAKIFLTSAFAMVPRPKSYTVENAFSYGVRMIPEMLEQMQLIRSLMPNIKRIGVMFSKLYTKSALQSLTNAKDENVELVAIEIQSESDVMPALRRYKGHIDGFLMIEDPFILDIGVISEMTDFLRQEKIPFFALDCSMVRRGATAAFGVDYFSLGRQLVDLVMAGKSEGLAQKTKLFNPNQVNICVNRKVLENMWSHDFWPGITQFASTSHRPLVIY